MLRRLFALVLLSLASGADGATLRGVVTGDVAHLPWRKGKQELGWCKVTAVPLDGTGGMAATRTHAGTGEFQLALPGENRVALEVSRPGFVSFAKLVDGVPPEPLRIHLRRDLDYGLVVRPRTGTAETCVPGEELTIECLAPKDATGWQAELVGAGLGGPDAGKLSVAAAEFGERAVWSATKPGWRFAARVPREVPAGMYRLDVAYKTAGGQLRSSSQESAVRVLAAYPDAFRLMPYCDFHLDWHVGKAGAAGEVQAAFFQAASLLNPLFVSLGDDIGFERDDAVAMFHYLVTEHCDVPVYLAFGNHDAGIGAAGYEHYFGPRWQTRRVGPHVRLILSYDLYQGGYELPEDQRRFVNAALARFHADPDVKLIFLVGHPHAWKPREDYFEMPFTDAERPAFPGHTDGGRTLEARGLFLHSLSVGSMHGWAGLDYTGRVMELEGFRQEAPRTKATLLPQAALPAVAFAQPNDGTASTNTATVRLVGLREAWSPPEGLYTGGYFCDPPATWRGLSAIRGARLRFVMRRGSYRCSPGRIVQAASPDGGGTTVLTVEVDVREPVVEVTVSPVAGP
jgi:hypothetical protein